MADDFKSLFTIERELGRGGYGRVFRVRSRRNKELFALKVVNLAAVDYDEAIKEVEVMKKLDHPNVVKCYAGLESYAESDKGRERRTLAIQLDFCSDGDLGALIKRRSGFPFTAQRLLKWMVQLSSAVMYIHSVGVLHRDLKPQNILLNGSGQLKLADFGISRFLTSSPEDVPGAGTEFFMAPELQARRYGPESDVYSLGCICLCLATCKTLPRPSLTAPFHAVPRSYGARIYDVIRTSLLTEEQSRWTSDQIYHFLVGKPARGTRLRNPTM